MRRSKQPTLARAVLTYFVRNPKAADSLEGVARWRLLDQRVQEELNATQDALEWLVERGYLNDHSGQGIERLFSLNRERHEVAEQFVAGMKTTKKRESKRKPRRHD